MRRSWLRQAIIALALVGIALAIWTYRVSHRNRALTRLSTASLRRQVEAEPDDPLVNYVYVKRLLEHRDAANAEKAAVAAADHIPPEAADIDSARMLALAGYLIAQSENVDEAEGLLRRAYRINTNIPQVDLGLGILAERKHDYARAEAEFRRAHDLDPTRADCLWRLGGVLRAEGEPEAALESLRRASAMSPNDAAIHARLGELLRDLNRLRESADEYGKASALSPRNDGYRQMLALALAGAARSEDEYRKAADSMTGILGVSPQDEPIRLALAGLHMRFGRLKQAQNELEIVDIRRRLILQSQNAKLHFRLALLLGKAGDPENARTELRRANELAPDDPEIRRTVYTERKYFGLAGSDANRKTGARR